ncbi:hypothetical protein D3C75_1192440 [compost metagenome]
MAAAPPIGVAIPSSAILRILSPNSGFSVSDGSVWVLTATVMESDTPLPAASVTLTPIVTLPSNSPCRILLGILTLHAPVVGSARAV